MKRHTIRLLLALSLLCLISSPGFALKGLWVWFTPTVIGNTNQSNILINQCKADGITHIYIYAYGMLGGASKTQMQTFIAKATCNNIHVWAMDGYRGYFADWAGSTNYFNFVNAVVNYNNTVASNERFYGIHSDNEPQDGQSEPRSSFHNDIADSDLSTVAGSGVWQSTEKLDREFLMRDWLSLSEQTYNICHANCLKFGQAMPSWLDDYYGEPVYCTYNSVNRRVLEHMMQYVDDYCIMSYRTTPAQLIARVTGELTYANSLPAATRPKVWAGLETHCGVGNGISYCDTPGKATKAAVNADITTIEATLNTYPSYAGMNIHDWINGWRELSPASGNTADPGCPNAGGGGCALPIQLISFQAHALHNSVLLDWVTAWERQNSYFEIERSDNGSDFISIGRVNGAGNSDKPNHYSWNDYTAGNIAHYYRLKQTDFDGQYQYSNTVFVGVNVWQLNHVHLSPEGQLQFSVYNESNDEITLELTDLSGRKLLQVNASIQEGINEFDFNTAANAQGIYLLRVVRVSDGGVLTEKIIL